MDINSMKNILVLKNLNSNMVEEAFVVLKDNIKIHKKELIDNKKQINNKEIKKKEDKDYIIKEAEMIVSQYISKIENSNNKKKDTIKLEEKYKRLKYLTIFLGVLFIFNVISIFIR